MLVCSSCSSALAITLNSKLSANTFDKHCQAYRNKIVGCHASRCPFRLSSIQELRCIEATDEELDDVKFEEGIIDLERVPSIVPLYMGQVFPEDSVRLMEHPRPSIIFRQCTKHLSETIKSVLCVTNRNAKRIQLNHLLLLLGYSLDFRSHRRFNKSIPR